MKGLQLIVSRIKQRNRETNLIAGLRAPMKVETGQGKYQFSLIDFYMILWKNVEQEVENLIIWSYPQEVCVVGAL